MTHTNYNAYFKMTNSHHFFLHIYNSYMCLSCQNRVTWILHKLVSLCYSVHIDQFNQATLTKNTQNKFTNGYHSLAQALVIRQRKRNVMVWCLNVS